MYTITHYLYSSLSIYIKAPHAALECPSVEQKANSPATPELLQKYIVAAEIRSHLVLLPGTVDSCVINPDLYGRKPTETIRHVTSHCTAMDQRARARAA